jgi:hypothetical protein
MGETKSSHCSFSKLSLVPRTALPLSELAGLTTRIPLRMHKLSREGSSKFDDSLKVIARYVKERPERRMLTTIMDGQGIQESRRSFNLCDKCICLISPT